MVAKVFKHQTISTGYKNQCAFLLYKKHFQFHQSLAWVESTSEFW